MKRMVIEIWVTDEAAAQATEKIGGQGALDEMVDEEILGVRVALPGGVILRAGETFG